MYLYGFTKYVWADKIWKVNWKSTPWDLFLFWDEYFLSLWDDISFFEQYLYEIREPESKFQLIEKKFISSKTIDFINYMVYQRYCPYYNVIKYFLSPEIDKLLERKTAKKKSILTNSCINWNQNMQLDVEWQNLIIFPDLWTLMNTIDKSVMQQSHIDVLQSTNTQNQKDKSRWNIKQWNTKVIIATHSEIFQDYKNLKKIVIFYPHKRYYSNQQDPRYKTLAVVQKMSEIYKCKLEIIEN